MRKPKPKSMASIAVMLLIFVVASAPSTGRAEETRFDDQYRLGGDVLEVKGTGILRYLGFIKAYAGALYTLPGLDAEAVLADTPKRLEVEYFVPLAGEDFGPATYEGLSRNLSEEQIDKLRERIDYHNSLYVDVRPGDRYALTYAPGKGTALSLNGRRLGVIEGADFASAIFSLWLGEKPLDRQFRSALLGMDG